MRTKIKFNSGDKFHSKPEARNCYVNASHLIGTLFYLRRPLCCCSRRCHYVANQTHVRRTFTFSIRNSILFFAFAFMLSRRKGLTENDWWWAWCAVDSWRSVASSCNTNRHTHTHTHRLIQNRFDGAPQPVAHCTIKFGTVNAIRYIPIRLTAAKRCQWYGLL